MDMDQVALKSEKLLEEQKRIEKGVEDTRNALKKLITEGALPAARAMKRPERRNLDKAGLNIKSYRYNSDKTFSEAQEAMADWILDNIYPDFNFDDLDNNICNLFALYTYHLSYQDNLATKN